MGFGKLKAVWAASLIMLFSSAAVGSSLDDYVKRIDKTRGSISILLSYTAEAEEGGSNFEYYDPGSLTAQIRSDLPGNERVEFPGGPVETDNNWLHYRLDAFREESILSKKDAILTEIDERLSALSHKVKELQDPGTAGRSKDEDKQKLAEILSRQEYLKPRQAEESSFQKWLREFFEWLSRLMPRPSPVDQSGLGLGSLTFVLQILLYVAIAAVIGFGIYKLAPLFFPALRRRRKSEKKDRIILGEKIAADESSENLFSEAEQMAHEGNLRGAIRKGYIALLCELSDRKIIGLARHKTNRDYLRDVRKRRSLHSQMSGLTGSFERHWYGFKNAEIEDWDDFRKTYSEAVSTL